MLTAVRCYTTIFSNSRTVSSTLQNNYTSNCSLGLRPEERKTEKVKSGKDRKLSPSVVFFNLNLLTWYNYNWSYSWIPWIQIWGMKIHRLIHVKNRVICSKYPAEKKIALCLWGVIIAFTVPTITPLQDITGNWKQKLNLLSLLVSRLKWNEIFRLSDAINAMPSHVVRLAH